MLKSSGERQLCLVPYLREEVFSLLPIDNDVSYGFFINALLILEKFPYIPSFWLFLSWKNIESCQMLFCIEMIMWFFLLHSINVYSVIDFIFNHPHICGLSLTSLWCITILYAVSFSLQVICWRCLPLYSLEILICKCPFLL